MAKHKRFTTYLTPTGKIVRVRVSASQAALFTPRDDVIVLSRAEAIGMLDRGDAVLIFPNPLKIRLNDWPEYRAEEHRRRGRLIPGVAHPDPSRQVARRVKDLRPPVFSHHCSAGAAQGRSFPPHAELDPGEREYRRHQREYIRLHSEASREEQRERERLEQINRQTLGVA